MKGIKFWTKDGFDVASCKWRLHERVNQKFNGIGTDRLKFNKFDSISWVAYAITNPASPQITILTGAKNLTTTVSYFVESDTATEGGTYINQ